jgi:hypothetical protein
MAGVKELIARWLVPQGFLDVYSYMLSLKRAQYIQKLHTPKMQALFRENIRLKDIHTGQRCFILGSGSSIKQQDLTRLAGEIVISVSNSFVHKDYLLFKPKYHILPPVFESHGNLCNHDKFIEWLREMDERTFDAEFFFHIGDKEEIDKNGLFRNRIIHWVDYSPWDENSMPVIDLERISNIWSVSETAITVAIYLGFEKIYLLGFDHDWFNGTLVYFYDETTEHKAEPDKSKLSFADSEFQMRRHAYIFKKYKYLYALKQNIYNANANPDTYVDVFPRVDYKSLFPDAI